MITNKFQSELEIAIAEWHDAMNTQDIETMRKDAGKKLKHLISRACDMKALELVIDSAQRNTFTPNLDNDPQYWIDLAEKEND